MKNKLTLTYLNGFITFLIQSICDHSYLITGYCSYYCIKCKKVILR